MSTDTLEKAKRLFAALGEMQDSFLEETVSADIAAQTAARKRIIQYSALGVGVGAAASFGIAVTCLLLRSSRAKLEKEELA